MDLEIIYLQAHSDVPEEIQILFNNSVIIKEYIKTEPVLVEELISEKEIKDIIKTIIKTNIANIANIANIENNTQNTHKLNNVNKNINKLFNLNNENNKLINILNVGLSENLLKL